MQSEASNVQQPITVADPAPDEHVCLDCGVDISHRTRNARRCKACSTKRDIILSRQRANHYYRDNRPRVLQRIKSQQQTPEYKQSRREWEERYPDKILVYRQRQKQKHREKTGYNPEGRTCEDCDADISHRGHNATRCVPCSIPPARTCMYCHADISKRGARAQFCNEECRRSYWQSKELEGYT